MATLLTISGLIDWNPKILEPFDTCLDYNSVTVSPNVDIDKVFEVGLENRIKVKIMLDCGMLESVYQDPDIMGTVVKEWVEANTQRWTRLHYTSCYKYNPLHNYDRTEEWEDSDEVDETQTGNGNNSGNSTSTRNVGAYNNNMQKAGEDISSGANSYTASGTKKSKNTRKHSARLFGNIGVTTTQEMIQSERKVVSFDIADVVVREFKQNFCIVVY